MDNKTHSLILSSHKGTTAQRWAVVPFSPAKQIPFLRYYSVFHLDQCEGIAARHAKPLPQTADTDEAAERIISAYLQNSGVKLEHVEGDQACYRPADDSVTLPLRTQFAETAEYYSTAFHELTHSTGHCT